MHTCMICTDLLGRMLARKPLACAFWYLAEGLQQFLLVCYRPTSICGKIIMKTFLCLCVCFFVAYTQTRAHAPSLRKTTKPAENRVRDRYRHTNAPLKTRMIAPRGKKQDISREKQTDTQTDREREEEFLLTLMYIEKQTEK